MSSHKYSIWLIPAQKYLLALARCINYNSYIARQPSFIPHLTLFSSAKNIVEDFGCWACQLDYENFSLDIDSIAIDRNSYFMNYYLKLSKTIQLDNLFASVRKLDRESEYNLDPHVSLVYGATNYDKLLEYQFSKKIIFDKIAIIKYFPADTATTVMSFEIVKSYKLLNL
ncbi:hypothetical protein [Francisella salimarina]|uniref:hypothetical protein n=1 Tax=Francisella salimarina TaxID=2599927 RepID=UPI003D8181E1